MTALPDFKQATFKPGDPVDNPYFPLKPSTIYVYEGEKTDEDGEVERETDRFAVTFETKEVAGVAATVVRDTAWANGFLQEDTRDWHAQDTQGNVWYLGEATTAYEYDDEGNFIGTSNEGEWEAGVNGAKPGYIMKANPQVGDRLEMLGEQRLKPPSSQRNSQEFLPSIPKSTAQATPVHQLVDTPSISKRELSYEFPINDRASLYVSTTSNDLSDFNPFLSDRDNDDDSSEGEISEFGSENPIYNLVEDTGLELNYDLTDNLSIGLGYFSGASSESVADSFNGDRSAFVQLEFEPSDSFLLGLTYIYTYNHVNLATETGSLRSQINLERPVVGHSYGISASLLNSRLAIEGWVD